MSRMVWIGEMARGRGRQQCRRINSSDGVRREGDDMRVGKGESRMTNGKIVILYTLPGQVVTAVGLAVIFARSIIP